MAEYQIIFKSGKIKNVVSKDVNKIKNYISESFNKINFIKRLDEEAIISNNGSTEKIQKFEQTKNKQTTFTNFFIKTSIYFLTIQFL